MDNDINDLLYKIITSEKCLIETFSEMEKLFDFNDDITGCSFYSSMFKKEHIGKQFYIYKYRIEVMPTVNTNYAPCKIVVLNKMNIVDYFIKYILRKRIWIN